jgi:hypothetical protein
MTLCCARALVAANRRSTERSPNRIAEALRETRASVARRLQPRHGDTI